MAFIRILGTEPVTPHWTDRMDSNSWRSWQRLEALLHAEPSWASEMIDSLASESLRVLRHFHDPLANAPFQGRGLVVGYVQSGKTANYTAVAARAADAGYRIVIVLSGIHDSLRNQTQIRLERELVGTLGDTTPAVPPSEAWILLTSAPEDFKDQDTNVLHNPGRFLIVAKKNTAILKKLDRWLTAAAARLADLPVLLIDDEADQASINTRGNRPLDPTVSDDEDDPAPGPAPSLTNALIRGILRRIPKATYIAYTATPFANILIDPAATDARVGDDLFPRDFAIQLPRPNGYTGTEELFGVAAQGRDVLRLVPTEDVLALREPKRRRAAEIVIKAATDVIPRSLSDALIAFCIAGAVRALRPGLGGKSHTMLVHVSQRTGDQARIAAAIRDQLELWREAERQGESLQELFAEALNGVMLGMDSPPDGASIITGAITAMRQLVVLELNSVTGENLEYDEKPGRQIVAVGGNRLSRGLTLEGLTVSYFLRTATMCDTLLQMARWYGFRTGYEDLIRIWTTDGIARWFTELALVEQSMRDSIVALGRAGRRPDQMAIRLRAHSALLLTARNKSGMLATTQDSFSGEHPQTVLLPLSDPSKLQINRGLAERFLSRVAPRRETSGGYLARDVPPEAICNFLQAYRIHDDIVAFRGDRLAEWIMGRAVAGELTDWGVFLASPRTGRQIMLAGRAVGLVKRSRISSDSIGILIDPRHEGVDLPAGPESYRRPSGAFDAEAMRSARPATQGLLIVYPLDAELLGVDATDTVIAVALSLPQTADAGAAWVVNRGVSDD